MSSDGNRQIDLLVGPSESGAAALIHAVNYPDQVERLVVIDPGFGYAIPEVTDPSQLEHNPGPLRFLNPATREEAQELLSLATPAAFTDSEIDNLWAAQLNSAWAMQKLIESWIRREDTIDGGLGSVKAPTLILWGAEDKITPPELGQRMHREISNSTPRYNQVLWPLGASREA